MSSSFLDATCCRACLGCAGCGACGCNEDDLRLIAMRARRPAVGMLAGTVFAIAWWVFIDALVIAHVRQVDVPIRFEEWVCGIFGTIALVAVNAVDRSVVSSDSYYGDDVRRRARLYIFLCLFVAMGAVIGSIVMFTVKYTGDGLQGEQLGPGIAVVVQNCMILVSSLMLWFGRAPANDW